MQDNLSGVAMSTNNFSLEEPEDGSHFFQKTSVLKKVYQKCLAMQKKYPDDVEIEDFRHDFRQMLNDIEVAESAMQSIFDKAIQGLFPKDFIPDLVSLLWHWQGEYVNLRKFKRFVEKMEEIS